jgi:hypothetical protein
VEYDSNLAMDSGNSCFLSPQLITRLKAYPYSIPIDYGVRRREGV